MPFPGDESGLVVMGRVVSAVGVQGWIRLRTFTEDAGRLAGFDRWVVHGTEGWREMPLEEFAVRPNGVVAKLAGCDDRDAAERLKGSDVAVPRQELGEAEEGSVFQVDLVGLDVVDEGGGMLGKLDSFFQTGETSVMVVRGDERERLIPFIAAYVKSVDREAARITVDWKADYDA